MRALIGKFVIYESKVCVIGEAGEENRYLVSPCKENYVMVIALKDGQPVFFSEKDAQEYMEEDLRLYDEC